MANEHWEDGLLANSDIIGHNFDPLKFNSYDWLYTNNLTVAGTPEVYPTKDVLEETRGLINNPDSNGTLSLKPSGTPGYYLFATGLKQKPGILEPGILQGKRKFTLDLIDQFKFLNNLLIEYGDEDAPSIWESKDSYTRLLNKAYDKLTEDYDEFLKTNGINPYRIPDDIRLSDAIHWSKYGIAPTWVTQGFFTDGTEALLARNMTEVSNNYFLRATPYLSPDLAAKYPWLAEEAFRTNATYFPKAFTIGAGMGIATAPVSTAKAAWGAIAPGTPGGDLIGQTAGYIAASEIANSIYKGATGSNQGYMDDALDALGVESPYGRFVGYMFDPLAWGDYRKVANSLIRTSGDIRNNVVSRFKNSGWKPIFNRWSNRLPLYEFKTAEDWDNAYFKAIAEGNWDEVLRIRDLHYVKSVPHSQWTVTDLGTPKVYYHGTQDGGFTIFDSSTTSATIGGESAKGKVKGNFLTPDENVASVYAGSGRYVNPMFMYTSKPTNTFKPIDFRKALLRTEYDEYLKKLIALKVPRKEIEKLLNLFLEQRGATFEDVAYTSLGQRNVIYPLYVNPGNKVGAVDFKGNAWSQTPFQIPVSYKVMERNPTWIPDTKRDGNFNMSVVELSRPVVFWDKENAMSYMLDRLGSRTLPTKMSDDALNVTDDAFTNASGRSTIGVFENEYPLTTNGVVQRAYDEGYTAVEMNNVADGVEYPTTNFVTFNSSQTKLANAMTFDNNGKIIPISQRDNWLNPDIRYSTADTSHSGLYTLPDGSWDMDALIRDIKAGGSDFKDWINNSAYRAATEANEAEAKAMGLEYSSPLKLPDNKEWLEKGLPITATWVVKPEAGFAAAMSPLLPKETILYNLANLTNARKATTHELAHNFNMAGAREPFGLNSYNPLEGKYMQYKTNEVFDETADFTDIVGNPAYDFTHVDGAMEALTNSRDLGAAYGVLVGQAYPGDKEVLSLIEKMKTNEHELYREMAKHFRTDNLSKVWKALNGTQWIALPTIVLGASLMNNGGTSNGQ